MLLPRLESELTGALTQMLKQKARLNGGLSAFCLEGLIWLRGQDLNL
jgi:hypothetical protein